jgi:hypothetical protein
MKTLIRGAAIFLALWVMGSVPARAQGFPDGPGKQIVQEACSVCHDTEVIASMRRSKAEWTETVQDMVSRGAPLKEGEREVVIEYLAANFGPDKSNDKANDRPAAKAAGIGKPSEVAGKKKWTIARR